MDESQREKLAGICPHGNASATCIICDKEKQRGTLRNKVSNVIRKGYKKFAEPAVQKISEARGKPTADSIANQLEESVPFDFDAFMKEQGQEEGVTEIDERGELKSSSQGEKHKTDNKSENESEVGSENWKSQLTGKILNMLLWLEKKGIFYIPSSARSEEVYRKNLFPEFNNEESLLSFLEGKFVVDVGSGTTHKNPYSLINVATRNKNHNITFLGVEPRVGTEEMKHPFNKAYLKYEIVGEELRRIFRGDFNRLTDTPGDKTVVAGKAENLPVEKNKVDVLLSNYLVSYLIEDEPKMLAIFQEFYEALTESGGIRLFPGNPDILQRLYNSQSELGKYMQTHFSAESNFGTGDKAKGTIILKKIHKPAEME